MAKKTKPVMGKARLQIPGGQATPAPPVGPALSQFGINLGEFVKRVNDATRELQGMVTTVVVTVFQDRTFDFEVKSPPAAVLLRQAAGIAKGSGEPNKEKVGSVTYAQLCEIAEKKSKDLNATNIDHAARMIAGTARSMGITVTE
jgi:large subunit ribosomal protein L11